jgi:hypothetical protein
MSFVYLAKGAGTGANSSQEQERRRLIGIALSAIGTAPFFADGVNLPLFDDALHRGEVAGIAKRFA